MQNREVDVAIIGAGTAGLSAWQAARQHGDKIVLIEGGEGGTTCARVGCMPSKLLLAAAEAAQRTRDATGFGIRTGSVEVDGGAVMAWLHQERDRFVGQVLDSMERIPAEQRLAGTARFESPQVLRVGDDLRVKARAIVIATGSRNHWPDLLSNAGDRLVVNDDVFRWQTLPESVAVFGPGIIGLELGQALHRLGVRLRIFGKSGSLGPFQDAKLRDYADRTFNESFYVDPQAKVEEIRREGNQVVITFQERHSGRRLTERFDYLLAATGRRPNLEALALEQAELELDEHGVPHFDRFTLQCHAADGGPSPVFIAGDANHELPLLHEASLQGRIAGDNAGRYPERRAGRRTTPLSIVFTDPQIATVGLSRQAHEERLGGCRHVATGEASFEGQGRAVVMRQERGRLHLYAEHGTGLLLGAELFGPQVEHMAHLLAWAVEERACVSRLLEMPFYHPVLEEALRSALRDLSAKLEHGPAITARCLEYGPGD
ncbi:dihydrolipoyl dehydrogenase [Halomonas sp. E14]|uniref:dihydrolipoyl dehydrogenase n=1 Tax=Halomonas sp. E14 TaxID=3397245 RepID=UPI00403E367E